MLVLLLLWMKPTAARSLAYGMQIHATQQPIDDIHNGIVRRKKKKKKKKQ